MADSVFVFVQGSLGLDLFRCLHLTIFFLQQSLGFLWTFSDEARGCLGNVFVAASSTSARPLSATLFVADSPRVVAQCPFLRTLPCSSPCSVWKTALQSFSSNAWLSSEWKTTRPPHQVEQKTHKQGEGGAKDPFLLTLFRRRRYALA